MIIFFASSIETVQDFISDERFTFYEYDLNHRLQMEDFEKNVIQKKLFYDEVIYINCAAVVHTEHFYHVYETYQTNVVGMNDFLQQAIRIGADKYINCSTSVYSMNSWNENGGVRKMIFLPYPMLSIVSGQVMLSESFLLNSLLKMP